MPNPLVLSARLRGSAAAAPAPATTHRLTRSARRGIAISPNGIRGAAGARGAPRRSRRPRERRGPHRARRGPRRSSPRASRDSPRGPSLRGASPRSGSHRAKEASRSTRSPASRRPARSGRGGPRRPGARRRVAGTPPGRQADHGVVRTLSTPHPNPPPATAQSRLSIQSSMLLFAVLAAAALTTPADLGPVATDDVRVFLVRHGLAYSNLDPTPDLPPAQLDRLTEIGRAQSRRVGLALKGRSVALVVSSPAGRARQSAEELTNTLAAGAPRIDARLRPLELGRAAAGQPLDWDARDAEWAAGRDPQPAGGESIDQVGRRVLDLVTSLARDHHGHAVVLVAHGEDNGMAV